MCALASATLAAFLLTLSFAAQAQPVVPIPAEYGELLKSRTTPAQLGPDLFGDEVNLYDGSLRFRQTDIALPGNDALPVALTRTFQVKQNEGIEGLFADWELEIPHLHGVFSTSGWIVPGGAPNNRCSAFGKPPGASGVGGGSFSAEEFWSGSFLSLPGGGGEILKATASTPLPTDGQTYPLTTRDGVVFRCLPTLANGTGLGEGFEAVTPDGVRYQFNHMVQRSAPSLFKAEPFPEAMAAQVEQSRIAIAAELAQRGASAAVPTPNLLPDGYMLNRREVWMLPTVITDRFGNTVTFTWDATDKRKLKTVASSDGRTLTFTHDGASHRIKTVNDGSHTWTYNYTATAAGFRLSSVTLPDASTWGFNLEPLRHVMASVSGAGCNAAGTADVNPSGTGTLTHPGGVTGSFTVTATEHGRSHVTLDCRDYNYLDGILGYAWHPAKFLVPSLQSKTLSGLGVASQSWNYSYGAANACYDPSPGGQYPEIGGRCVSGTSPVTTTVSVTDPENAVTRYTFGNRFRSTEGQLLKIEAALSGATALRTTTNTYAAEAAGPWPNPVGLAPQDRNDGYMAARHRPVKTRSLVQQGAAFTWSVPSTCASNGTSGSVGATLCFDRFARQTQATETGSASRTTKTEYYDHTGKWVLGQVKKATLGSTVVADIGFDATYALPLTFTRFGQLQHTAVYDTASAVATGQRGTLYSLKDGNNKTTTYTSWKRGIPQTLAYPDSTSESAVVNNVGGLDSVTDELGYKTCYGYDAMGRLSTITHPSETAAGTCDTSAWNATTIAYAKVAAPGYALPANVWRRTETTGTRKTETFYDGAWQPILERRSTTDASAGERFVRRSYFPIGRSVFESFPVASVPGANYTQIVTGTHQDFDDLGRLRFKTIDSELGLLTHETAYPTNAFTTVHTNARGKVTTTTYQTFAEPSYEAPLVITAPEGTTSTYTRDPWSKPLTLTRSGSYTPPGGVLESLSVQRRFVYDLQQRLCKTIEPDAGITVMDYDAAGNLAWRALGQAALTATNDCQRASVAAADKSVHQHDARNRLLWINHPTGTSDVGYSYAADGAMLTASVSQTGNTAAPPFVSPLNTWTYTYKRRRLPEKESLAISGVATPFDLTWAYNPRGDVSSLTYPGGGGNVSFNPNAYGEPRQVGTYATLAAYHPHGGLASFTYGNATTRAITPNSRQLPWKIVDVRSGTKWLDHTLTYDENGNLKSLTDSVIDPEGQPSETRTLTYDARDRLLSVTNAPTGNETYAYDPLDNLRRAVRGGVDRRFHVSATTQRLGLITTVGSTTTVDHGWNDRGELATRTNTTPSAPVIVVPPAIHGNGFEEPLLTSPESFTFDRARRLTAYQDQVTYQYDAHNRRVLTTIPNWGNRHQIYSRASELLYVEDTNSNERTQFFHLNGTLVAERSRPLDGETATVSYLHSDHRGTPTVKTSSLGTRVYRSRLMPYGTPYDGIYRDGPGFTKHATDTVGPLVYMQQRYYDPGSRFISPDPDPARADNFNRYAYANNNPYTFVDPDGRWACQGSTLDCSRFEDGLARVSDAANSERLTQNERDVMQRIVALYGSRGDATVSVSFSELGGSGGNAAMRKDGSIAVTIDLSSTTRTTESRSMNALAKIISHEGDHGVSDRQRGRSVANLTEREEHEKSGYRAQAYFQKAANFMDNFNNAWSPWGGIDERVIDAQAKMSVIESCQGSTEGSCR